MIVIFHLSDWIIILVFLIYVCLKGNVNDFSIDVCLEILSHFICVCLKLISWFFLFMSV